MSSRDATKALATVQLIIGVIFAAEVLFGCVVAFLLLSGNYTPGFEPEFARLFAYITGAIGLLAIPVATVIRKVLWASAEGRSDRSMLQAFVGGCLAFFAILEGGCFLALLGWLLTGQLLPTLPVAVVLMGITGFALFSMRRVAPAI